MLQGLQVTAHITCIAILRDQFQSHLLTASTNQDGYVRLLSSLWLIDCASHLVILSFKGCLFLYPHCQNHLQSLTQLAQAFRCIRKWIAIRSIFMLVPTCADAEIQTTMAQNIEC